MIVGGTVRYVVILTTVTKIVSFLKIVCSMTVFQLLWFNPYAPTTTHNIWLADRSGNSSLVVNIKTFQKSSTKELNFVASFSGLLSNDLVCSQ